MGKKRQKKSGAGKKRSKKYTQDKGMTDDDYEASGAMASMVGGFRRAVGVEKPKKKNWKDYLWTILLLLAVLGIIGWQLNR